MLSSSVSYHKEPPGSDVEGIDVCLNTFGLVNAVVASVWASSAADCAVAISPSCVGVQTFGEPLTKTYNLLSSSVSYQREPTGDEVEGIDVCLKTLGFEFATVSSVNPVSLVNVDMFGEFVNDILPLTSKVEPFQWILPPSSWPIKSSYSLPSLPSNIPLSLWLFKKSLTSPNCILSVDEFIDNFPDDNVNVSDLISTLLPSKCI